MRRSSSPAVVEISLVRSLLTLLPLRILGLVLPGRFCNLFLPSALGRSAVGTLSTLCADRGELEGCRREN